MCKQLTILKRLSLILRLIVGAVFVASAVAKLLSIDNFELYLFGFGLASLNVCFIVARLLIAFEMLLGLAMILSIRPRATSITATATLGVFSAFLVYLLAIHNTDNCHCMGEVVSISPVWSLVKNIVLAAMLIPSIKSDWGLRPKRWFELLSVAFLTAAVFIYSPPDNINPYLNYAPSLNAPVYDSLRTSFGDRLDGRRIVCFYSTQCEYCTRTSSKISSLAARHGLDDRVLCVFMDFGEPTDSLVRNFFEQHSHHHPYPYVKLSLPTFLRTTNGDMPVVLLTDDGIVRKEYNYRTVAEGEIVDFFEAKDE